MVAKFVFSIDCEGKWGIADRGEQRQSQLTSKRLFNAYSGILTTLNRNDIRASFGFVGALCMNSEWLHERLISKKEALEFAGKDWLEGARLGVSTNDLSGWSEPSLIELVIKDGGQHICSHGGFHVPYDEKNTPEESIINDIKVIQEVRNYFGLKLDLLIYPRNVIGYQNHLAKAGFKAYRGLDRSESISGFVGKAYRIANEFLSVDCDDLVHVDGAQDGALIRLSSAKFLNAKIGIRKAVAACVTKKRVTALIKYAVTHGATVHFYTHPHNFISDPTMMEKLDYLMRVVAAYEKSGDLKVMTMEDELNGFV